MRQADSISLLPTKPNERKERKLGRPNALLLISQQSVLRLFFACILLASCGETSRPKDVVAEAQSVAREACACEIRSEEANRRNCWREFDAMLASMPNLQEISVPSAPVAATGVEFDANGQRREVIKWFDVLTDPPMRVCSEGDAQMIERAFLRRDGNVQALKEAARGAKTLIP